VKKTRDIYSQIHNLAAMGREIVTVNAAAKGNEVSHIDKAIFDFGMQCVPVTIKAEQDAELNIWTVSVDELDIYGEGPTKGEAVEDLVTSTLDYLELYYERLDLYARYDTVQKKAVVAKLARCEGDREKLRRLMGV